MKFSKFRKTNVAELWYVIIFKNEILKNPDLWFHFLIKKRRIFLIKRLEHKPDLTTGDTRPKVLIQPSIKKEERIDLTVEIAQEVVEQRAVQRGLDRLLVL